MTFLTSDDSAETLQPRKILITIDQLGAFTENLIVYSLLVTQNIICNYTLLYCPENFDTEDIASKKIVDLLEKIKHKYSLSINQKLEIIVSNKNLLDATLQIEQEFDIDCVILTSSHREGACQMDDMAHNILFQVSTNVLTIPSNVELVFPSNVGVLTESYDKSNLEKLTAFNSYISQFRDTFINFVLFADTNEILDHERKALGKYNDFFDSNFKFTFILQDKKKYCTFFKSIEENHTNAAVIVWDENSMFFKHYLNNKSTRFPCSPNLPVYYAKKNESINSLGLEFTPFI